MTNKKTTRKALFSSMIALLLCCAMLVGSTFAWFTDSVTSGVNQITAGNLDVDVFYTNEAGEYESITGVGTLFDDVKLWEPGVVSYENLIVKNLGNLALKYQLSVNFTNATKTPAGKTLADVLQVAVVEGGITETDRDKLVSGITNWKSLAEWIEEGELLKQGDTATYGVVIWWEPGDNDNDFNMNNGEQTVLSIDLGISLVATQKDAEFDSFGNDYDEGVVPCNVVVTNEEELVEALANATTGTVIGISGNVTWTTGSGHGSTPFVTDAKSITLVGVDENATFTAIGSGVGPVGIDDGTVTFKNLTIKDESVSYAEDSWEFGYLEFRGNTVFENCNVVNAIMMSGTNADFINCSFNSNKDSEYAVWVDNGSASFTNCTFTGARGLKTHEAYGSEVDTIIVDSCIFGPLSKKPGVAIGTVNADTTVTIKNSAFIDTQPGDQGNYMYESDTDVITFNFTCESISATEFLTNALENAKAGTVITLAENVDYGTVTVGELKDVVIKGAEGSPVIFKTDANTKIVNVTLQGVEFAYTGATADCGVVIDANAQIDNLVIDGCTFTGTGAKAGRGLSGANNNASIVLKNCTFKDLGYPIYAWGGYKALTIEGCTFENIKSWAIMPQGGFDGDLTVTGCTFKDCLGGGLIKAGTLTAGHTFTFTNNTVTGCTIAGDHNWFQFNVSAGTAVINGNTKDGASWTPGTADGLN